jgi:hypothetical protein
MDAARLRPLLGRIADLLGHDLRTPLGSVVNYVSLFELDPAPTAAELRDVAGRVRGQVAEVAALAQLVVDALAIVAAPPAASPFDPVALLESVAHDVGDDAAALRRATSAGAVDGAAALDAPRVGFAWRAFLRFDRAARRGAARSLEVRRAARSGTAALELWLDGAPDLDRPAVALDRFVANGAARVAPSLRFALEVARELVGGVGGTLELFGAAGATAGIRLTTAAAR